MDMKHIIGTNPMTEYWFPTIIYKADLSNFITEEQNSVFYDRSIEYKNTYEKNNDWRCNTFGSINVKHVNEEPEFSNLIELCKSHVINYSNMFGVATENIICNEAWVNVAPPGAYQEYHMHPSRHFSLVYYVKTPINSGNIVFRSFEANFDMFPLPIQDMSCVGAHKTCFYSPQERGIMIFRSNLLHMVETNNSNENRVSIAMNFTFNK